MMTDVQNLVVPLWGAISVGAAVIAVLIGAVVWVFTNFPTKIDHSAKHTDHENRIKQLEQNWGDIKSDLSYIRGRLEPKP